jgi:hypothetical protein
MDLQAWMKLGLFMLALLSAALQGLAASGHFPAEHRKPALQGAAGTFILFASIALTLASVIVAVYAVRGLPWYALIIGGGGALLLAPLALQPFSDRFVDGRGAVLTFALAAMGYTLLSLTLRT